MSNPVMYDRMNMYDRIRAYEVESSLVPVCRIWSCMVGSDNVRRNWSCTSNPVMYGRILSRTSNPIMLGRIWYFAVCSDHAQSDPVGDFRIRPHKVGSGCMGSDPVSFGCILLDSEIFVILKGSTSTLMPL
jgi:hypothetical protein